MIQLDGSTLDPRIRQFVLPQRVVWQTTGKGSPSDPESLLKDDRTPCVMRYEDEAPGILVDFGRELHGGILLENGMTPGHAPVRVRVRFGESVSEAMGEPNNDHAIHNEVCQIPWYGATEIGNTGFRFARIDLVDKGTELQIRRLRAVFLYRDLPYRGAFRCSDERLNRVWETGAYTVHLCMQEMLWDGIKRDRLVWLGDMHPETMVVSSVFGETDVIPRSMDFVRNQTPLPRWMNGISSYSLWWILIQLDWYRYHGNREYLEEQRAYLLDLLKVLQGQIGENGSEKLGEGRFLDWPSSGDKSAIHMGLHALLTMALEAGATLCDTLGEAATAGACRESVKVLRGYTPPATSSKQANALVALAGLRGAEETNRGVLAVEPLTGISTFYGYYVLQARAAAGDYAGCLEVISKYWGAMLDLGATTFWEDFNLAWAKNAGRIDELTPEGKVDVHTTYGDYCYKGLRHSLCHGWAAGPTAWMSEHVLGFRPLTPGSRKLLVRPHLGGLEFAEGRFPTPHGEVSVSHRAGSDGKVVSEIDAPEGIEIVR